jgi:PPOX class probable F420-dependent enzyme
LAADRARSRFVSAKVARLATVREDGSPHVVPIVFALLGNRVVHVLDAKPKSTDDPWKLQRIRNIVREPRVTILADSYDEEWANLWWARADAIATVLLPSADGGDCAEAVDALAERYPQYRSDRPTGLVIVATVIKWTGWSTS